MRRVFLNALDVWAVCHGRTLTVVSQTSRREGGASRGCNDEPDIGDGLLLLNCDPLPQSRLKWQLLIFFNVLGSHLPSFAALLGGLQNPIMWFNEPKVQK